MNYAFTDNIKDFFAKGLITASQMISGMNEQQLLNRDQTNEVTFNLLDSHDTARVLTLAKKNKALVKSMLTFMFMQKGAPCIYYGTEIGMDGGEDPECRKCMEWETGKQDLEMLAFTKKLIAWRKKYSRFLAEADTTWDAIDDDAKVITLSRKLGDKILSATFNEGDNALTVKKLGEVLLGQNIAEHSNGQFILQKHGFVVFACE